MIDVQEEVWMRYLKIFDAQEDHAPQVSKFPKLPASIYTQSRTTPLPAHFSSNLHPGVLHDEYFEPKT